MRGGKLFDAAVGHGKGPARRGAVDQRRGALVLDVMGRQEASSALRQGNSRDVKRHHLFSKGLSVLTKTGRSVASCK